MPKPTPKKYRTTNWRDYNHSLKQRGALLLWIDKEMDWLAPASGKRGRAEKFSDAAIQFCLMVKNLFGLTLRQVTGMVASLLKLSSLRLADAGLLNVVSSPTAFAGLHFLSA